MEYSTEPNKAERRAQFLLVVDSDANDLFYTSMLLQRLEYHICSTKTAEEALEMATVAVPALIIAELTLTGMSGLELTRRLRQKTPTAAVPVILEARQYPPETMKQCLQAGIVACLKKPIQAEELFRVVQAAIEPKPRANMRIHTRLPVTVNNNPLDCIEGECASVLSEHGMYIRTLKPFPVNTPVTVQISLGENIVSADAVIIYCHRFGEGPFSEPGMGMQFVNISPEDQERIRLFIRDEVTRGITPL